MAGYQINTASLGDGDWTSWISANEKVWKGYIDITVNNWDTTGVPSIAAGGCMELGGSIFYFGDTEAITGTPSTANLNYIMVTASSSNVTASYTTTAPSWIANKGGWYDATEAKRYIGGCGINKHMKFVYDKGRDNLMHKKLEIGEWNIPATTHKNVAHGLPITNIAPPLAVIIRNDVDNVRYPVAFTGEITGDVDIDVDIGPVNVTLSALNGGFFDSVNFNSTDNRGWITVNYEV